MFKEANLAQLITLKMAKLGPVNNSTAHIYIYSIYAVESKLGPKIAFFESKLGPSFLLFSFFFKNRLLSAERMRLSKNLEKKKTKITLF